MEFMSDNGHDRMFAIAADQSAVSHMVEILQR